MSPTPATWRFHAARKSALQEVHARPSTPIMPPAVATRLVSLSGVNGLAADHHHIETLCARLGVSPPAPEARWFALNTDEWSLRWERHTEASAWTFFRRCDARSVDAFAVTALDMAPRDWLQSIPGEILVAAHVALVAAAPTQTPFSPTDLVASDIEGAARIITDFLPGPDGFTRFIVVREDPDQVQTGRTVQQLFELETYRLMALLAYPVALATATALTSMDQKLESAALHVTSVANEGGVEADRTLLEDLAAMAGEAEAVASRTNFRFAAAEAYYGIVEERIATWRERGVDGRPTLGQFMERRLAPAMRTCASVSRRQRDMIDRIARTVQLLNVRVQVASEKTNVDLLASMDRRSHQQFQIQQAVERLSVVAIAYYALGLLKAVFDAVSNVAPQVDATIATGLAAPVVVYAVWRIVRRVYPRRASP